MYFFVDTSALAKRYILEKGSHWMQALFENEHHSIIISQLSLIEIVSALTKRQRMGDLTLSQAKLIQYQVLSDCKHYQVLMIDKQVTRKAIELLNKHPLRAYDAVQLATALMAQHSLLEKQSSFVFVCADHLLCQTATHENMRTKNPVVEEDS